MPSYSFGAGLIGTLVSAVLLGATYMQTIYYFLGKPRMSWVDDSGWNTFNGPSSAEYPKDSRYLKALVCGSYSHLIIHYDLTFQGDSHCCARHNQHGAYFTRPCVHCLRNIIATRLRWIHLDYYYLVTNFKYSYYFLRAWANPYRSMAAIHLPFCIYPGMLSVNLTWQVKFIYIQVCFGGFFQTANLLVFDIIAL